MGCTLTHTYIHTLPTGLSLLAPVVGIFTFIACVSKHFYSHKMSFHVVCLEKGTQTDYESGLKHFESLK